MPMSCYQRHAALTLLLRHHQPGHTGDRDAANSSSHLTAIHFTVAPCLGPLSPMPHCNTFHNYPMPWVPVTHASLQYISQMPPCLGPVTHASLQYISQLPLALGPSPMPHCNIFHSCPLALGPSPMPHCNTFHSCPWPLAHHLGNEIKDGMTGC